MVWMGLILVCVYRFLSYTDTVRRIQALIDDRSRTGARDSPFPVTPVSIMLAIVNAHSLGGVELMGGEEGCGSEMQGEVRGAM